MIKKWLRKYFVTLFVLATLMGVFHQHNDLQVHEDCQICTITSSIADGDIPQDTLCLIPLEQTSQATSSYKIDFFLCENFSSFRARAPPKYS